MLIAQLLAINGKSCQQQRLVDSTTDHKNIYKALVSYQLLRWQLHMEISSQLCSLNIDYKVSHALN